LESWLKNNDTILSIPEVWSARSFWEWPIKPNVLVTIDEERHKQNLLEINQNHMWGTIKFWRHMLEHEAKENDIKVVNTFEDAVLYLNEN
jgi:galactose-1-phosphate uridylyltransferase